MRPTDPFQLRDTEEAARDLKSEVHVFGPGFVCDTESRGYPTPKNRNPAELLVNAPDGFIPLWAKDVTLRWRFQERSMSLLVNPEAAKTAIKELLGEALLAWGKGVVPVKFAQRDDLWDFEIALRKTNRCDSNGCVLASSFFPDSGRHKLVIYPKLFSQSEEEQVETLIHEIGHIFGLRHFFANISETEWPAEVFGTHQLFTIMNYGPESKLTDEDKADLKRLYQMARSGELTKINGTEIRLVKPFHYL